MLSTKNDLVTLVTVENLIDAIVAGQTYAQKLNGKVIKERVRFYPTSDKLLPLQPTDELKEGGGQTLYEVGRHT